MENNIDEDKKIPHTDMTYCHGICCNKYDECSRYVGKYEFEKNKYYSFMFNCDGSLFKKE